MIITLRHGPKATPLPPQPAPPEPGPPIPMPPQPPGPTPDPTPAPGPIDAGAGPGEDPAPVGDVVERLPLGLLAEFEHAVVDLVEGSPRRLARPASRRR